MEEREASRSRIDVSIGSRTLEISRIAGFDGAAGRNPAAPSSPIDKPSTSLLLPSPRRLLERIFKERGFSKRQRSHPKQSRQLHAYTHRGHTQFRCYLSLSLSRSPLPYCRLLYRGGIRYTQRHFITPSSCWPRFISNCSNSVVSRFQYPSVSAELSQVVLLRQ